MDGYKSYQLEKSLNLDILAKRVKAAYLVVSNKIPIRIKTSNIWKEIASFLISKNVDNALNYCYAVKIVKGKIFPNFLKSEKVYQEVQEFLSRHQAELLLELRCQLFQFINEVKHHQQLYRCDHLTAVSEVLEKSSWLNPVLALRIYNTYNITAPDRIKERAAKRFYLAPDVYRSCGFKEEQLFSL